MLEVKRQRIRLPDDVGGFMDKAAYFVGSEARARFEMGIYDECTGDVLGETSPIEVLFYVALRALCEMNLIGAEVEFGVTVVPQKHIGPYRVDFLLISWNATPTNILRSVVVELDGHQFHERTEKQRRYEKARDRYLQGQELTVFHFTGAEVVANPWRPALEVLASLGACDPAGFYAPDEALADGE